MSYLLNVPFEYTFEIKKIIKRLDDGFTIAEAKSMKFEENYNNTTFKEIKIKGMFPVIFKGDTFKATVTMHESYKYGYYLDVTENLTYILPHTKKALITFLRKKNNSLKKEEAEELVKFGGRKTISKLTNELDSFYNKTSLSVTRLKNIKEKISGDIFFENLMLFMQTLHIGAPTACYIYQQFGLNSIARIKENPYSLCRINEISFKEADFMANCLGLKANDIRRVKSCILEYLTHAESTNGDVYVEKEQLLLGLVDFSKKFGAYPSNEEIPEEVILKAYCRLIDKKKIIETKKSDETVIVYLKSLYEAELSTALSIKVLLSTPSALLSEQNIEDYIKQHQENASKQSLAIKMAFSNRISILTGGPGTGKTYTVNQIVHCLTLNKPDSRVILLAPTGRASSKLSEVTKLPAFTIHKAIHVQPTNGDLSYKNKDIEPLVADFVIVDEGSMIDIQLFSLLLNAIGPETTLLIVGDENQLASVGPGLVLRDLISSKKVPVICLDEIFRQAQDSQIVMNAHKLKEQLTSKDENGLTFDKEKGDFFFIQRNSIEEIANTMIEMTMRLITKKKLRIEDILLLSPIKNDVIGVENLNRELQKRLNPPRNDKEEYMIDGITCLRIGDKVINTKNDNDLNINNGDIGKIKDITINIDSTPKITVEFYDKDVVFTLENIKNLELAYCITVHKAQGSETKVVIMPISANHLFNLNRRLVYTAWTRAKDMVVCVGDLNTLDDIVLKTDAKRNSCLKERVIASI